MADKRAERLIRPHLRDVQVYHPVDPPEVLAERAGIPAESVVKLNGNENPYGPSPKAAAAVADAELPHLPRSSPAAVAVRAVGLHRLRTRRTS